MSMNKIYTCNICKERLDKPSQSFGLNFANLNEFTLGSYGCTEGTHICYRCAKQLYVHLNNKQIKEILGV